jgi:hypothetical protein
MTLLPPAFDDALELVDPQLSLEAFDYLSRLATNDPKAFVVEVLSAVEDGRLLLPPPLVRALEDQLVRTVPSRPAAAVLVCVHAALDDVRCLLLGIGATSRDFRSKELDLVDHVLVLGRDADLVTTVAISGPNAFSAGRWLAEQAKDRGWRVGEVLPPKRGGSSGLALSAAVADPVVLDEYRPTQETEAERSA